MTEGQGIDYGDISVTVEQHVPSGERYAMTWASIWRNNECVGATIIKIAGPLSARDTLDLRESKDFDGDDTDLDWANDQTWTIKETIV